MICRVECGFSGPQLYETLKPYIRRLLIHSGRYVRTLGILGNGRVLNRHRRRLSAITTASFRRGFLKWLHAQPQECQHRLAHPQRGRFEAARTRLARHPWFNDCLLKIRFRVHGCAFRCRVQLVSLYSPGSSMCNTADPKCLQL